MPCTVDALSIVETKYCGCSTYLLENPVALCLLQMSVSACWALGSSTYILNINPLSDSLTKLLLGWFMTMAYNQLSTTSGLGSGAVEFYPAIINYIPAGFKHGFQTS